MFGELFYNFQIIIFRKIVNTNHHAQLKVTEAFYKSVHLKYGGVAL